MPGSDVCCSIDGIPGHLHQKGREPVDTLHEDDRLFLWHSAFVAGERYSGTIPGFRKEVGSQSCNSELLNPEGDPGDVTYDTRKGGAKMPNLQVACIPLAELKQVVVPHRDFIRLDPETNKPLEPKEFKNLHLTVRHDPTPCMYPHCEIKVLLDGAEKKEVPRSLRADFITQLATIAEQNRLEMEPYSTRCH